MKQVIIILMLVSFLILAGCSQETIYVCSDGTEVTDSSDCSIQKEQLTDSEEIMEKGIRVECNGDEDCPGGYCDMRGSPPEWECKEASLPSEFCGNEICDKGETYVSCPRDCTRP
ncbi:hypothetical protein GOV04_05055 [Candidatus Woesearchaeota archaeon]|nr:hypothetical protein [Candidatus Woesearchaeota archaeon]